MSIITRIALALIASGSAALHAAEPPGQLDLATALAGGAR
jgi:hypothetical protein